MLKTPEYSYFPSGLASMENKNRSISPSAGSELATSRMPEVAGSISPHAIKRIFTVLPIVLSVYDTVYSTIRVQCCNSLQAIPSSEEERCARRGVGSSIERQVGSLPESAAEMLGPTPRRVGGDNGARPEPEPAPAPAAADRRTDWRPSRDCCRDLLESNKK